MHPFDFQRCRVIALTASVCLDAEVPDSWPYKLNEIRGGVFFLQLQPHPWPAEIGRHVPGYGLAEAIEEHSLDAGMVVEELHVNRPWRSAADVQMHAWTTMR